MYCARQTRTRRRFPSDKTATDREERVTGVGRARERCALTQARTPGRLQPPVDALPARAIHFTVRQISADYIAGLVQPAVAVWAVAVELLLPFHHQGGQRRPGDSGRERREFAGGLRSDRTLPRSSCLARCSSCCGAALPRRYVSREGERGVEPPAGGHRYTSRAARAEPKAAKDYAAVLRKERWTSLLFSRDVKKTFLPRGSWLRL
jgi:hypothetical protein